MKRKLTIVISLFLSMLLIGCFGYQDITILNVLLGISVDVTEDKKIMVTGEYAEGNVSYEQDKAGDHKSRISSSIGDSIYHAFRKGATSSGGKRYFYPSIRVVAIGENLANQGIEDVVDFFVRDPKRRTTVYFVLSKENGYNLFSSKHETIDTATSEIVGINEFTELTGYGVDSKLYEFIKETDSICGTGLLNVYGLKSSKGKELMMEGNGSNVLKEMTLQGTGVLYKYKLVGYLNLNETLVTNIIKGKLNEGIYVVNKEDNRVSEITIKIKSPKIKCMPDITSQGYVMNIDIKSDAYIVEYTNKESLKDLDLKDLGNRVSHEINKQILNTFNKAKYEFNVDIFNFAADFAIKYPEILKLTSKEWSKIFSEKVMLKPNTIIKISGSNSTIEKVK